MALAQLARAAAVMFPTAFAGVAVGAAAGVTFGYALWGRRPPEPETPADVAAHPALRYGAPVKERLRQFKGFVASYDSATRNASWVAEHLDRARP